MKSDVVIIGSGNLARHLTQRLALSGFSIQMVARTAKDKVALKEIAADISFITDINLINQHASIYIICVKDDAIIEVATSLPFYPSEQQLLLHSSGSTPSHILKPYARHYGVLWPIMSITKNYQIHDPDRIPFVLTTSDQTAEYHLTRLAQYISTEYSYADDETRQQMHLIAVVSNNFTNHLFALAYQYCTDHHIDFNKFQPIIIETVRRMLGQNPGSLQTGPAIRNDKETINKHLTMLKSDPSLEAVYKFFTASILKMYS